MESKATFKHIRIAPPKLRKVINTVRGKDVQKALDILTFERQAGAVNVKKIIRSALSSATEKGGVRVDKLYVKEITVDQGPTLKDGYLVQEDQHQVFIKELLICQWFLEKGFRTRIKLEKVRYEPPSFSSLKAGY